MFPLNLYCFFERNKQIVRKNVRNSSKPLIFYLKICGYHVSVIFCTYENRWNKTCVFFIIAKSDEFKIFGCYSKFLLCFSDSGISK